MKSTRAFSSMLMIPLFGVFSALAACSGQTGANDQGSAANPVTAQSEQKGERPAWGHRPAGPEGILFAALHEPINLTADQKSKIEAAIAEVKPKGPPPSEGAHRTALAAAVRAGKIDVPALQPSFDDKVREEHRTAMAKAIKTLHDTLTKDQRVALVDAMSKRAAEHGPKEGGKPEWKKGEHKGGPMGHLLKDLDLTKEQEDAIRAKLEAQKPTEAEREAMKQQHEAMRKERAARLQTFVADDFDAVAFVTPPAGEKPAKMGMGPGRMLNDLAVIVPLLTPAQREKLAQRIEAGPPAH